MPLGLWDQEWPGVNGQRRYPLADTATATDVTGSFVLPDSFLVELSLAVPWAPAIDARLFFLASIAVFPIGYAIAIGYDDGSPSPPVAATATFAAAGHAENRAYPLVGAGDFAEITGSVTVGVLDDINRQPPGQWAFDRAGGTLDPDCIRPAIRGVASLVVTSGGIAAPPLYGDVELVAGTNVRLTVSGQSIRIDAIDGAGLTEPCACTGSTTPPPPIRTINGIPPDGSGNFALSGNACLSVTAGAAAIALSDLCSQPCCGCQELDALTAELAHVNDEATTMAAFLAGLQAQLAAMEANVLGSRLADAPCLPPCA